MIVNGPTGSGKTRFCRGIVENASTFIDPPPQKIQWHYGVYQKDFTTMPKSVNFREGLPDNREFDGDTPTLLVIDDMMNEINETVCLLFTRESHHRNLSVIFVTQNIFQDSKFGRTINLNSQYLALFKNPRDVTQVTFIARQMCPGKSNFLTEAYKDATSRPFGYLFLDYKADTDDELRVRTNVIPGEIGVDGIRLLPYIYRPSRKV